MYEEIGGGKRKFEEVLEVGPKDQNISKSYSNMSLTQKRVHLVMYYFLLGNMKF